jgi:hypothetical protein
MKEFEPGDNLLYDEEGNIRAPGYDKNGNYSTAQMMQDEFFGGDTSQPLFD